MAIERRAASLPVELRQEEGKPPVITGYAAVYYRADDPGTEFELWKGMRERIMPGAFDRAIREDDVRALFNHDSSLILGRTKAATLRLSTDERGLRYEIDAPDTQAGRDLVTTLKRGDVTGSSFAFETLSETFRDEDDLTIRELNAVRLWDVSPVTYPAYEATAATVRSVEAVEASVKAWRAEREAAAWQERVEADARARSLRLKELG